jgi:hypothetical protein
VGVAVAAAAVAAALHLNFINVGYSKIKTALFI